MGLANGEHGVKNFAKTSFPEAVTNYPSLAKAREAGSYESEEAVVLLDGNVLMNLIPMSVITFDGYMRVFSGFVRQGFDAADHVIIVFDEPEIVTRAKAAEQRRRDASRSKNQPILSADLEAEFAPTDDDFGLEVVHRCNPHTLLKNRAARGRFYDALLMRVFHEFVYGTAPMRSGATLTLDGIDCKGGDRPHGTPRTPGMVSSSDKLEFLLERRDEHAKTGEGDLKFVDLQGEIQVLKDEDKAFQNVSLVIVSTIDTDSIAIELLHQSSKIESADERETPPITTLLAFREAGGKRKADDAAPSQTNYACFDVAALELAICTRVFGAPDLEKRRYLRKHAIALLAMAWAAGGCDFAHVNGMRASTSFDAVVELCRRRPKLVQRLQPIFEIGSKSSDATLAEARAEITAVLRELVAVSGDLLAQMPRLQRATASVRDASEAALLRVAWVGSYWSGYEPKQLGDWGF
jgi:hypothetical protein